MVLVVKLVVSKFDKIIVAVSALAEENLTMKDEIKQLTSFVKQALDMVYDKDYHLISNRAVNNIGRDEHHHVGERSIVFRFAHYLQNIIMNP